jgi:putative thiamine transport system ATP-binding protein
MSLELINLHAETPSHALFSGVSAQIAPGEILAVMGPSGAGKSTLLNIIAGFANASLHWQGEVWLAGERLCQQPTHTRKLGLVSQTPLLFPHLSVGQNLGFGIAGALPSATRRVRIHDALDQAGLDGFADRDPQSLSGGQRARVSLLRTLLSEPRALLLDEPFSSLDEATKDDMRSFTAAQIKRHALPTLLVTHDPRDADCLSADTLHISGAAIAKTGSLPATAK